MQNTIKTLDDVKQFLARKNIKILNGSILFDLGDDLLFILGLDTKQEIKLFKKSNQQSINIAPNHCHMTIDLETVISLLTGEIKSYDAYTSGRIKISGSSAVALKLQNLLG
ncbi:MAG: SCP2 sterol-binding domain-containing protein [Candidatus Comchoanobacterales bacterium]